MSGEDDEAPPNGERQARAAERCSSEYLLRSLRMIVDLADGELVTGLITMAIIQANVAHLDLAADSAEEGDETVTPDSLRRPVSVLALSDGLGLPYETTRRHVAKLVKSGDCVRGHDGVIVPAAMLATARQTAMRLANLANLRRLFRNLQRAGVKLA